MTSSYATTLRRLVAVKKWNGHRLASAAVSNRTSGDVRGIFVGNGSSIPSGDGREDPHAMFKEQMEQLRQEREDQFGFTEDDHQAWSNAGSGNDQLPASLMKSVETARAQQENDILETTTRALSMNDESSTQPSEGAVGNAVPSHGLTHLSEDGSSVNMVDVGNKQVTTRTAKAKTRIIFPPEVVDAFRGQKDELVGKKGPIFATAKTAGIMAAKKTSDLIPLCHPLPLDKVQIDIHMENESIVIVSCECRVTYKTGVEMEALMGASVAALTIYDMTKAISHNIRIEQTMLVSKSGGKRTVG